MRPVCEAFGADAMATAGLVVVIPACNEAERIGACLDAMAAQEGRQGCAVHVCVNNTDDDTARIVRDRARRHGLTLMLSEVRLPRGGVGRARRFGHLLAMRFSSQATAFLSTDADSQAAPGWIVAMRLALESHPAVLGRIEGLDDLPADVLENVRHSGQIEDDYMRLSMEFARLVSGDEDLSIGLNTASGANLGLRREVYRAVGGFRALPSREDRDLIDRVIAAGYRPVRAQEAVVRASMRPDGRAPGGMADKIAERLSGNTASLDTALAPVSAMLAKVLHGSRQSFDLSPAQAAADLPILATHVEHLRQKICPEERRRYLRSAGHLD